MIVEIRMPEVAADMTEADVVGWLSAEGDPITQGDILFEIETDKSTVEIEAPATGVLTEIRVPAGQAGVAVGALLAIMEAAEEVGVEETEASRAADPEQAEPGPDVAQTAEITPQQAETRSEKPEATALARRIAQQAGLDIGEIQGSGARGRVLRADVEETLAEEPSRAKAEPETYEAPPHEAHASAPQPSADLIHLNTACRFDPLIRLTAQLNQGAEEPTLSWQVGLIRAIATAIRGTGFLRTDPGDEEVLPLSRLRVTDGSSSATALLVGAERQGVDGDTVEERVHCDGPGQQCARRRLRLKTVYVALGAHRLGHKYGVRADVARRGQAQHRRDEQADRRRRPRRRCWRAPPPSPKRWRRRLRPRPRPRLRIGR